METHTHKRQQMAARPVGLSPETEWGERNGDHEARLERGEKEERRDEQINKGKESLCWNIRQSIPKMDESRRVTVHPDKLRKSDAMIRAVRDLFFLKQSETLSFNA